MINYLLNIIYPYSEFSAFQKHRQNFIPGCPIALSDTQNQKVSLTRSAYPVDEGIKKLFPTLLAQEMPLLEMKVDQEGGQLLKSDVPLRVSNY